MTVLTAGEVMALGRSTGRLKHGDPLALSIAGAEANVAIGLARLGHDVAVATALGDDDLGDLVERTLRAEGVTCRVRRDPDRPTGLLLRDTVPGGAVRVSYYRNGSAASQLTPADVVTDGAQLVHLTGITPALSPQAAETVATTAAAARAAGAVVSFDVNHRATLWSAGRASSTLRPLLAHVDVLFASVDELPLLVDSGDPTALLGPGGPTEVVVTDGARGARALSASADVHADALPVHAVDVVGAGDAFVAGYLSARLDGLDLRARLTRGVTVAALAVTVAGDWEGLPTRAELLRFTPGGGTVQR